MALANPEAVPSGMRLTTVKSGCRVGVGLNTGTALVVAARVIPRARSNLEEYIIVGYVILVSDGLLASMEWIGSAP